MNGFKFSDALREHQTSLCGTNHAHSGASLAPSETAPRKLIDSKTLDSIIGLSASSRYRYIKKGLLPQPVRWPGCKNLWNLHEVYAYIERNNANACKASASPDKMEGVEGPANTIFLVNDYKNKNAEVPYTSSTTEEECEGKQGGQS